jgi:hypothetical protein
MQITLRSINPYDGLDAPKMIAVVNFYDETAQFHNSATVEVFLDKRDASLSELKVDAIQKAINFLKLAVSVPEK